MANELFGLLNLLYNGATAMGMPRISPGAPQAGGQTAAPNLLWDTVRPLLAQGAPQGPLPQAVNQGGVPGRPLEAPQKPQEQAPQQQQVEPMSQTINALAEAVRSDKIGESNRTTGMPSYSPESTGPFNSGYFKQLTPEAQVASEGNTPTNFYAQRGGVQGVDGAGVQAMMPTEEDRLGAMLMTLQQGGQPGAGAGQELAPPQTLVSNDARTMPRGMNADQEEALRKSGTPIQPMSGKITPYGWMGRR